MGNKLANGYYITAYCAIDALGNILDAITRHDQNISLWYLNEYKIELLRHWEIERLTGIKKISTPFLSETDFNEYLDNLLAQFNINIVDMNMIVGLKDTEELKKSDSISYHSLCHLYSSMLSDTKLFYNDEMITLALDGGPDEFVESDAFEKYYYAGSYSNKGEVKIFPVASPGVLWEYVADYFFIREGTLMALAYASESESYIKVPDFTQIYKYSDVQKCRELLKSLIEEIYAYSVKDSGIKYNYFDNRFTEEENKISMIMKIIQKVSIEMVEKTIDEIITKFNIQPQNVLLSLSGGYILNCPTNTHLMHKYKFKKQITIPCVNDGGQAIGMGLKFFYDHLSKIEFSLKNAFYGDTDSCISNNFMGYIDNIIDNALDYFVQDIIDYPIIWFEGRSEIGPRALGHRSILADSRSIEAKNILNKIKQRQWWRPVAPIVIGEKCNEWFKESFESPFMLNNFTVREDKESIIPAVLHIDKTARVQTINEDDGLLFIGLKKFEETTNVPIICNTSLNDRGEPIISTIDQALNFALRKGIKVIYFNGKRIKLKNHENYLEHQPLKREDQIFTKYKDDPNICQEINPYQISLYELYSYRTMSELRKLDLKVKEDVLYLKKLLKSSELYNKKVQIVYDNISYKNRKATYSDLKKS